MVNPTINPPCGDGPWVVAPVNLWWFCGWLIIGCTKLNLKKLGTRSVFFTAESGKVSDAGQPNMHILQSYIPPEFFFIPVKNQALDACMAAARRYQNRSRARHRFASRQPQVSSQRIQRSLQRGWQENRNCIWIPSPYDSKRKRSLPQSLSNQVPKSLSHYYLTCFRTSQVWMLVP